MALQVLVRITERANGAVRRGNGCDDIKRGKVLEDPDSLRSWIKSLWPVYVNLLCWALWWILSQRP